MRPGNCCSAWFSSLPARSCSKATRISGRSGNETILAVLFVGLFGVGLAHFLWWSIVGRLPTVTASLGSLLVPVIGVTASAIVLGERLTVPDIVGFAMIFAAAACVLLQPNVRHDEMPECHAPLK